MGMLNLARNGGDKVSERTTSGRRKVLAVASAGGHWVQLMRILPSVDNADVVFITTGRGYEDQVGRASLSVVCDASRASKLRLSVMIVQIAVLVARIRPDVVISTGAAPGYVALRAGRLLGARTIWLDSIANVDEMSLSGRMVRPYADLWLTQWPHLARSGGPLYAGSVV
jgi:UDP-N-acetylglucosamine:LPS N-acetylglucosamine transferase